MRLAVSGEDLLDLGVGLLACLLDGGLDHAPAAVGHHRTLERHIGLKADADVVVLADVARGEGVDVGRDLSVDVVDAALALFGEVLLFKSVPHAKSLLGWARKEGRVAFIRGVVLLDEVADIDGLSPVAGDETLPCLGVDGGVGSHNPLLLLIWSPADISNFAPRRST